MMRRWIVKVVAGILCLLPVSAWADGQKTYTIVIKDHHFDPAELKVPVGETIKLVIDNRDAMPEEFESPDLKREKVIQGNRQGTVVVGPLRAGTYHFAGEFHEDTAKGAIIAEQKE